MSGSHSASGLGLLASQKPIWVLGKFENRMWALVGKFNVYVTNASLPLGRAPHIGYNELNGAPTEYVHVLIPGTC